MDDSAGKIERKLYLSCPGQGAVDLSCIPIIILILLRKRNMDPSNISRLPSVLLLIVLVCST